MHSPARHRSERSSHRRRLLDLHLPRPQKFHARSHLSHSSTVQARVSDRKPKAVGCRVEDHLTAHRPKAVQVAKAQHRLQERLRARAANAVLRRKCPVLLMPCAL